MTQMIFASTNRGKFEEFKRGLEGMAIELIFAGDLEESKRIEVEETGTTYEENASLKAKAYAKALGMPAIADDSGLEVACLGGKPGVYSARMGSDDMERLHWLLSSMEGEEDRRAQFVCAISVSVPKFSMTLTVTGRCSGKIIDVPRGKNGFGYDPVFVPDGYDKTFAELGSEVKEQISHRANALKLVKDAFKLTEL